MKKKRTLSCIDRYASTIYSLRRAHHSDIKIKDYTLVHRTVNKLAEKLLDKLKPEHILRGISGQFSSCGKQFAVYRCEKHGNIGKPTTCKLWICDKCEGTRRIVLLKSLRKALQNRDLRLLTLTYPYKDKNYPKTLANLRKDFYNFRRRKNVKKYIKGGVIVFEFKPSGYVHAHVIYDGFYMPHKLVSSEWLKATKKAYIVDIRRINTYVAVRYVLKYITKMPSDFSTEGKVRLMYSLWNRRKFTTFGSLYNIIRPERLKMLCPICERIMQFIGVVNFEYEIKALRPH